MGDTGAAAGLIAVPRLIIVCSGGGTGFTIGSGVDLGIGIEIGVVAGAGKLSLVITTTFFAGVGVGVGFVEIRLRVNFSVEVFDCANAEKGSRTKMQNPIKTFNFIIVFAESENWRRDCR